MKIILEEKDIIELLGKALGTTLDPNFIKITTDPFEVTVNDAGKVLHTTTPPTETAEVAASVPNPQNEMTEEDVASLMGVSDQIVNVGIPTANPSAILNSSVTTTNPKPTKDGKEVFNE